MLQDLCCGRCSSFGWRVFANRSTWMELYQLDEVRARKGGLEGRFSSHDVKQNCHGMDFLRPHN